MDINYDEKGKFFTEIINKEPIEVKIQTVNNYIEGEIYIRPEHRMKNELDQDEKFLAVTNARVFGTDKTLLFSTKFIAVHRDKIIWIVAVKDLER
jgi:hypothetical protein